ncbi:ATP-dependent DNA ligase, partial [Rhizobium ruizarguesonis]
VEIEKVEGDEDRLYLDGHDLTGTELEVRRHLLEDLIPEGGNGTIRISEEIDLPAEDRREHAGHRRLEGIIARHRDRPYR